MIVELGAGEPAPERLQAVLAQAMHDTSIELAFWLPDRQAFVDAEGTEVAVAAPPAGRAVTYVERDGVRVAALLHDAALDAEPATVGAAVTGAGPALQDARLLAAAAARLADVRASRARIVEAGDTARKRAERALHDGPQQRLLSVALVLRLALGRPDGAPELRDLVTEATDELAVALGELRGLARGIYPVLLTDTGLGPALASLVERCAIPAHLGAVPDRRFGEPVEQTCYFVVSEALANAVAHARAGSAVVVVREQGGQVEIEVSDDGVGGADPGGPGLRGLADRVAARGGTLRVVSPAGGGTRVLAGLPCA